MKIANGSDAVAASTEIDTEIVTADQDEETIDEENVEEALSDDLAPANSHTDTALRVDTVDSQQATRRINAVDPLESPLRITPSGRWCLRKSGEEAGEAIPEAPRLDSSSVGAGNSGGPGETMNRNTGFDLEIAVGRERDALLQAPMNTSMHSVQSISIGSSSDSGLSHPSMLSKPEATPYQLYDDIYGLIYLAQSNHPAFFFAIFIVFIQSLLLVLIFFDMVQVGLFESVDNALNGRINRISFPAAVPVTVTVAQFLGIILTILVVASEGDLTRGCSKLFDGYQKDLNQRDPNATYTTWLVGAWAQVLVGVVMTADCFILIMQSNTVVEMCLNFAALHFVQEIDDVAFAVAQRGYITKAIQEECERVADDMTSTLPWLRTVNLRRLLLFLTAVGLLVPFCVLVSWQWSGYYLCGRLNIQFGDSASPDLDFYSGIFQVEGFAPGDRIDYRTVYVDQSRNLQLAYCSTEKAWVFSNQTSEPCKHFFIQSSRTETFDVLEISGEGWSHRSNATGEVSPIDWLSLSCIECKEEGEKEEKDKHNYQGCHPDHGKCKDQTCECFPGRMGANCEYAEPTCRHVFLGFDSQRPLASEPGSFVFFNQYAPLNHTANQSLLQINHRPVYVSTNHTSDHNFAFIIFSGRRWIMFGKPHEEHASLDPDGKDGLRSQLQKLAAGNQSAGNLTSFFKLPQMEHIQPLFFSTPVNHGTESDSEEPTNVGWVVAQHDEKLDVLKYHANDQKPASARLKCIECDDHNNPCLNSGECHNGECVCLPSYHGPLCEFAYTCQQKGCIYGGECDNFLGVCRKCDKGFYGNLCQYSKEQEIDPFFCTNTTCKNEGTCDPFLQKCECKEGFGGEFCDTFIILEAPTGGSPNGP